MTLPDASLAVSDDNTLSEESRRQAIRARELLHFARHIQRSRQRLKEHHDHLAWLNRQVTQKISRQRIELAQWEADRTRHSNGLGTPPAASAIDADRLEELERALAEEREARQRTQAQLDEVEEKGRAAERRLVEHNGRQTEYDRVAEDAASLRQEVESLRQELALRREELETTARCLEESRTEIERLRVHEVEGLRSELAGHQSELEQTRRALAEAREHADRIGGSAEQSGAVESLRRELAEIQAALAERDREHAETLAKLADLEGLQESTAAREGGQNKALLQEIEQLNRLLAERDQAHSEAATHLSELKRSHQATLAQLTQELEEARRQLVDQGRTVPAELPEEVTDRRPQPMALEEAQATAIAPSPIFAAAPERPRTPPPARASRPSLRIPPPAELTPTVIAPTPAALRAAAPEEQSPGTVDWEVIEAGLGAMRKSLELDRRAVEDELLRPDEIRSGLRPPSVPTADLTSGATRIRKAREMLKTESERLKRDSVASPPTKPAIPDKGLASRRAAVESSPIFELPPSKPAAPEPPEPPPPAKPAPPVRQRGTLHGLRKWLGEK
jgi:chromosome segregation ATPase